MAEFKPMVKMYTTEPSVELKLKKGGHVKTTKMKVKEHGGHKMMDGGVPPAPMGMPARGGLPTAAAPMKPSLAMRRRAMRAMPAAAAPAAPVGMAGRMLKKGGKAEGGESMAEHMKEMREMKKTEKELKKHESLPASKAHKGLKKGGKACYATGGVAMGQAGFKKGGKVKMAEGGVPKSGIINTEGQGGEYRTTKMHEAKRDTKGGKTGEVKEGNAGGYKKGGKACYKDGGRVMNYVDGNVVGTPAGKTNTTTGGVKLSNAGGFKKGGSAKKAADGGKKGNPAVSKRAQKFADGGPVGLPTVSPTGRVGLPPVSPSGRIYDPSGATLSQQPGSQAMPIGYDDGGYVDMYGNMSDFGQIADANAPDFYQDAFNPQIMYSSAAGPKPDVNIMRGRPSYSNQGPGVGLAPPAGPKPDVNIMRGRPRYSNQGPGVGLAPPALPPINSPSRPPLNTRIPRGGKRVFAFADGGSVNDSGRPEKMPQGSKRPPTPVSINQLSGTYKKGGKVKK